VRAVARRGIDGGQQRAPPVQTTNNDAGVVARPTAQRKRSTLYHAVSRRLIKRPVPADQFD
jgi:hypothetical protein